ncbi:MAG: HDOD domain-containing protein [Phycisphaerales bacterium]|nr:HDOD domain-containing protein [Phycisphaerales bacterium]
MDTKLLDDILNCPSLPSLPAVAIRVLELTSDPDVKMDELAKEIQFDQGIAAKILRTVNSSFYGLRKRCSSIEHALVMLGLNPVKSLVLGFSLVSTVKGDEEDAFDYLGYWERGLTTAVAAKFAAEMAGNKLIADEAFLAGLFQDIGMVAMHRTIGNGYIELLNSTDGDHTKLTKAELDAFELQHAVVGAMMCENWKIPHEIVIPVRYHDRPTACPQEQSQTARCVALGNMIHGILKSENPTEPLRRTYAKAMSWLGFNESQVDELIKKTGGTTKELANLFSIDVGSVPDPEEVLAKADRQMIELSKNQKIESFAAKQFSELLSDDGTDPFTGALNREAFSVVVRKGFEAAYNGQFSLSVVQVMIDGYDDLGSTLGESSQDEIVIGTHVLLVRHFEHMGGIVCRLTDSVFAIVLPTIERVEATQSANACCEEFSSRIMSWIPDTQGVDELVKISVGVATLDEDTRAVIKTPELLVQAASRAVLAAKTASVSVVRAFVPRNNAA